MMKIFRWLLTTMFLLALSGAFAVLWVNEQFRQEYELAGVTEVSVPRGAGLDRPAALLGGKGVGGAGRRGKSGSRRGTVEIQQRPQGGV